MSRNRIQSLEDCRDAINQAIEENGQFSHNICSCVLRIAADKFGTAQANALIDEFALDEVYSIHKQEEKP